MKQTTEVGGETLELESYTLRQDGYKVELGDYAGLGQLTDHGWLWSSQTLKDRPSAWISQVEKGLEKLGHEVI